MFVVKGAKYGTRLLAATGAVVAKASDRDSKPKIVCRPSELPLYTPPRSTLTKVKTSEEPSELENMLLAPVGAVREFAAGTFSDVKGIVCKAGRTLNETAKNFTFVVEYLREEENTPQRYGAVAMGTLTGFIFGLRGGIVKRIVYATIGTGIMASICFPEDASRYFAEWIETDKKFVRIVYNFIYGIKPGDPQPDIDFPSLKMPHSVDEIFDLGASAGKAILNAMSSHKEEKSDSKNPTEK